MSRLISYRLPQFPKRNARRNARRIKWRPALDRIDLRQRAEPRSATNVVDDGVLPITGADQTATMPVCRIGPVTPNFLRQEHFPAENGTAENGKEQVEMLSRAVTLTVLELGKDREILLPAYLMANVMSPALWDWREERRAHAPDGGLLGVKRRLKDLQRQFHRYNFTNFPNEPGGDPWGLVHFEEEERRLGTSYVRQIKEEWDRTLKHLLKLNPDSQFGRIISESYYQEGCFPRLRNETFEIMNAYARISPDGKPSGKCGALTMLWAAALMVWGRFPMDQVAVVGNRAHLYAFLDADGGHLFNNAKWFSGTRIGNGSELSEYVRVVATSTDTTFVQIPAFGMWDCDRGQSRIPRERLPDVCQRLEDLLATPLKRPNLDDVAFLGSERSVPDPLQYESAQQYQQAVGELATRLPMSVYDFAQYAFRAVRVSHPQAYACAANRDYHAREMSRSVRCLEDAIRVVENIPGTESIFSSRERIALPDETLRFHTGTDRDKALLLYTLLHHCSDWQSDVAVGFSDASSYVRHGRTWIDVKTCTTSLTEPEGLWSVFNDETADRIPNAGHTI